MENNDNHNKDEQQHLKYDPAGETKKKIVFFIVAIVVLLILKVVMG
jgi:t-SNARE complex subunit (syntaxin)